MTPDSRSRWQVYHRGPRFVSTIQNDAGRRRRPTVGGPVVARAKEDHLRSWRLCYPVLLPGLSPAAPDTLFTGVVHERILEPEDACAG